MSNYHEDITLTDVIIAFLSSARSTHMMHKILWESNTDLAEKCLNHPFVIGLADGSLEQNAFRIYVAQDAFYLNAFIKAYALALAKSNGNLMRP